MNSEKGRFTLAKYIYHAFFIRNVFRYIMWFYHFFHNFNLQISNAKTQCNAYIYNILKAFMMYFFLNFRASKVSDSIKKTGGLWRLGLMWWSTCHSCRAWRNWDWASCLGKCCTPSLRKCLTGATSVLTASVRLNRGGNRISDLNLVEN